MGIEEISGQSPALQKLAKSFRPWPPARCLKYWPTFLEENPYYMPVEIGFWLCLYEDGTGIALPSAERSALSSALQERTAFRWDDLQEGVPTILSAPTEQLQDWCDRLFDQRINPKLPMPFLDRMQNVPATWTAGSERLFRDLVRAICLTEPDLFQVEQPVNALYEAALEPRRGGFLHLERFAERVWPPKSEDSITRITTPRLERLGSLVFRLNPFVGLRWVDLSDAEGDRKVQCVAARVSVLAEPPTAHEKAEAFLLLTDWLDENLTDPGQRALACLPPTNA